MYYRPYYEDNDFERQTANAAVVNVNYPPSLPVPPPVNAPYCVWKKYWKSYWLFYNWWRMNGY